MLYRVISCRVVSCHTALYCTVLYYDTTWYSILYVLSYPIISYPMQPTSLIWRALSEPNRAESKSSCLKEKKKKKRSKKNIGIERATERERERERELECSGWPDQWWQFWSSVVRPPTGRGGSSQGREFWPSSGKTHPFPLLWFCLYISWFSVEHHMGMISWLAILLFGGWIKVGLVKDGWMVLGWLD